MKVSVIQLVSGDPKCGIVMSRWSGDRELVLDPDELFGGESEHRVEPGDVPPIATDLFAEALANVFPDMNLSVGVCAGREVPFEVTWRFAHKPGCVRAQQYGTGSTAAKSDSGDVVVVVLWPGCLERLAGQWDMRGDHAEFVSKSRVVLPIEPPLVSILNSVLCLRSAMFLLMATPPLNRRP